MGINPIATPQWATVPELDFSPLARIPQMLREGEQRRALSNLPTNPDGTLNYGLGAQALLKAGDREGAMTLARLHEAQTLRQHSIATDQRDFAFRQQEAQRAQSNADRAAAAPQIKTVKDANGAERMVQVDRTGNVRPIDLPNQPGEANNPFAPQGNQTEGQANASLYARRMLQSERVLREVEKVGADPVQRVKAAVPYVGNYLVNEDYQKFDQAKRDFTNAVLRRESGAVISDAEFANADKQYFPQPGDTPAKIEQKRRNRQEAISGIAGAAGKAFRPDATFGPNGELVSRGPAAVPGAITKEQFDKLPSGATFTAPDGTLRVKP